MGMFLRPLDISGCAARDEGGEACQPVYLPIDMPWDEEKGFELTKLFSAIGYAMDQTGRPFEEVVRELDRRAREIAREGGEADG